MYRLVNKVFERLQLETNRQKPEQVLSQNPFITIARDPGSGGKPIAKLIARKLEFKFYDEALIEAIAKSAKRRKQIIAQVDEKSRNVIEDLVHNLFNPNYVSDETYIKHLVDATLAIAHKGKSVILGRGTNFIAPAADGLHILVTAPREIRIKRAIKFEKVTKKKALSIIDKVSKEREAFVSQYFGKDYSDPAYYDLIVNTEFFDLEMASDLIITAFRKKFPTVSEMVKTRIKKTGNLY